MVNWLHWTLSAHIEWMTIIWNWPKLNLNQRSLMTVMTHFSIPYPNAREIVFLFVHGWLLIVCLFSSIQKTIAFRRRKWMAHNTKPVHFWNSTVFFLEYPKSSRLIYYVKVFSFQKRIALILNVLNAFQNLYRTF